MRMRPSSFAHARDEVRQHRHRIRRPVPVVTAVQRVRRAVERDLRSGHAAHAEHDLLAPRLVHRSIAEEPGVGPKEGGVLLEDGSEVSGARFLLALEEQLEVHRRPDARGLERVDGREHRDDRRLVVARRAAVEAPFALHRPGAAGRHRFAAGVERPCRAGPGSTAATSTAPGRPAGRRSARRRRPSASPRASTAPRRPPAIRRSASRESSRAIPRDSIIARSRSAFRRMLAVSDATFGMATKSRNSRTIDVS